MNSLRECACCGGPLTGDGRCATMAETGCTLTQGEPGSLKADRFRVIQLHGRVYVYDMRTNSRIGFATTLERAEARVAELNRGN